MEDFSFEDLRKGLECLTKDECPTCFNIKDPWCDVMKCDKAKELQSCLLGNEFASFLKKHKRSILAMAVPSLYEIYYGFYYPPLSKRFKKDINF